jgi:hypothetical protein
MGKDSPPVPGTISKDKACELAGLDDRRLRQIAEKGYFPPPDKSRYQADAFVKGIVRYYKELSQKKSEQIMVAEQRLAVAKADIAEDERDRGRELYVLKSEIGPALRNISLHQRAVLQRKLENELGPKLAGLKTQEIIARLRAAVDEVCGIFQEGARGWMDCYPDPTEEKAAAVEKGVSAAGLRHSRGPGRGK